MRSSVFLSVAAASLISCVHAQSNTIEFFYTPTVDTCSYENNTLEADGQTEHGGVCAWRPDVGEVYACPAPDPKCWTWGNDCPNSTVGLVGQVVCNSYDTVWCCNAVAGETCTTTANQINICISSFDSPNSGVSVEQAQKVYLSAIGEKNVTATVQTVLDPTPFSTSVIGGTTATSTASSSATSSGSASTGSASTGSASTGSASTDTDLPTSSSGLSIGAIVGVAVAGAGILIAAIVAAFFFGRRRNARKAQQYANVPTNASPNMAPANMVEASTTSYYPQDTKDRFQDATSPYPSSELALSPARVEMPATNLYQNSGKPGFAPQELP